MSILRLLCSLLLISVSFGALACGPAGNLLTNCAFDVDTAGYQAQEGGDSIAHEPDSGNLAPGAMRVTDTDLDGNSEAEAETCVDLSGARQYELSASFLAIEAEHCLLGWDEFEGPDCTLPNGVFVSTSSVAVNQQGFTALADEMTVGSLVQSVELVILCVLGSGEPEFLVDDIAIFASERIFDDRFEGPEGVTVTPFSDAPRSGPE
jgi:hypothetical protein